MIWFIVQSHSFDTAMQPLAKPKPAPEVGAYGLVMVGVCLVVVIAIRWTKSKCA